MNWNTVIRAITPVVVHLKTIFTSPDVQVMVIIRNDSTGDQFEAGDIPTADVPAWLRRAADTVESNRGREAAKGVVVVGKDRIDVLDDKSKKEN